MTTPDPETPAVEAGARVHPFGSGVTIAEIAALLPSTPDEETT